MENENLPFIQLDLAGAEFQATPLNTHLFTFAGRTLLESGEVIENATRNHVFIATESADDGRVTGTYIFAKQIVEQMASVMVEYGFPCQLNQRSIPVCDEEAFQRQISQQVEAEETPDFIPDDWK